VRDARGELESRGVVALGISPDAPEAQAKFDGKYELGFPLLSDPDKSVATAYGAYGEKTSYGRTTMGIIRSSFLVGEDGRILRSWYGVKPDETVPKALEALGSG
jgi:peroxiredoxin Q/BCP